MDEPVESSVPQVALDTHQMVLIGQLCGRTITVPEFDLLFPGVNQGVQNENLAHCCCSGWITISDDNKNVTFEVTLQTIEVSFKEALTDVIGQWYEHGKAKKLTGFNLEMFVLERMPGAIEMLDDYVPPVVQ